MGTWNIEKPYGNDAAADWLGNLMQKTAVRTRWLNGIKQNPANEPEIVRAAVWLFEQLGHVFVWPVDHYAADLELAIGAAEALREVSFGRKPTVATLTLHVHRALVARRKPTAKTETAV